MKEFMLDADGQERLKEYFFNQIGGVLELDERKASYAVYAMGLLSNAERKSMEPIAAQGCPEPEKVEAHYQRLQHFLVDSRWSDWAVRRAAAHYALELMRGRGPIKYWIIDDTGFLKQGKHSVGVKRQYTGSAGKVTNCQVGVSLTVATATAHLPVDFELYLPREWLEDQQRRSEARIPQDVTFKTKPELALQMLDRALQDGIEPGMVLVDALYGNSSHFRRELRRRGLQYAVAVKSTTKVWQLDSLERRRGGRPLTVAQYADQIIERGGFRQTAWREGTKRKLSSRFAVRRVLPIADEGAARAEREVVWLLMEWEDGQHKPNKFYFLTAPKDSTKKQLVQHVKQRWRIERSYQDLKGQLGLDHYEGRRFPGWHHHVSVVLSCYAFIVAEQARRFPPSAPGSYPAHPYSFTASAPLC